MPNSSKQSWQLTSAIYIFVVVASLLIYGYQFPSENNYVEFPPILSLLNPELYKNDFYVQEMIKFNPRYYYNHLIYFSTKLGLNSSASYFLYYSLAFSSVVLGLYTLGKRFGQSKLASAVLAFLGLCAANGTIGFVDLFRPEPIPAIFAMGFSIWGIYFCLCQRWIFGYLFFGFACLLQFLVGVLPGGLMASLLILDVKKNNNLSILVLPFLLLGTMASLVYVPMMLTGDSSTGTITNADFVYIYGKIRHPHHIIFSTFGLRSWLNFILFMVGGLLCIQSADSLRSEDKTKLSLVIATSAFALLLGYIFVEVYPLAFIAKLQLARTTPFAQLMVLIAISVLVDEHYRRGNMALSLLLLITPFTKDGGIILFALAGSLFALKATRYLQILRSRFVTLATVVVLPLLLINHSVSESGVAIANDVNEQFILLLILSFPFLVGNILQSAPKSKVIIIYTLAFCSCLILSLGLLNALPEKLSNVFNKRLAIYQISTDEVTTLALRFKQLSSKDALILVPPSSDQFRFYSERAVVFDFRSFPYTVQGIQEWTNRLQAILGSVNASVSNSDLLFRQRSSSELVDVANRFQANYILTQIDWHPNIKGLVIDKEGKWLLYKLSEDNG
jgi:hypothetical protein